MGRDDKGSALRRAVREKCAVLDNQGEELKGGSQGFPDGLEAFDQESAFRFPAAFGFQRAPGLDAGIVHAGNLFHNALS